MTGPNAHGVTIARLQHADAQALSLLDEYYDAVQVVKRDTAAQVRADVEQGTMWMWTARADSELLGCVLLRPLPCITGTAECKRLYVRPAARGRGVAGLLMTALEDFAAARGFAEVYLDTHDGLVEALALYATRGYRRCDRYNDNPQATVFLRKQLAARADSGCLEAVMSFT